jgi:hypothetical protein
VVLTVILRSSKKIKVGMALNVAGEKTDAELHIFKIKTVVKAETVAKVRNRNKITERGNKIMTAAQ